MASRLKNLTASGDVHVGDSRLKSVVAEGGSAATVVDISDASGSAGTALLSLSAPAGDTVVWTASDREGAYFATGIRADITTTGGSVSFEFDVL